MFAKVFRIYGLANVEPELQSWLNSNKKIKIISMAEAAILTKESEHIMYTITIIYTYE